MSLSAFPCGEAPIAAQPPTIAADPKPTKRRQATAKADQTLTPEAR
jgi:hypothetical protein